MESLYNAAMLHTLKNVGKGMLLFGAFIVAWPVAQIFHLKSEKANILAFLDAKTVNADAPLRGGGGTGGGGSLAEGGGGDGEAGTGGGSEGTEGSTGGSTSTSSGS